MLPHEATRRAADGLTGWLAALDGYARSLATSDAAVLLSAVVERREELEGVERTIRAKEPEPAANAARRRLVEQHHGRWLADIVGSLAARIEATRGPDAWKDERRETFLAEKRALLAACLARDATLCPHRLVQRPLRRAVRELRGADSIGPRLDVAVMLDDRFVGVADADRPSWSGDRELAERYAFVKSAAGRTERVRDVIEWRLGKKKRTFTKLAVALPISGSSGRGPAGYVMVATPLDDVAADAAASSTGVDVSYLAVRSSPDGSAEVRLLGSSLDSPAAREALRTAAAGARGPGLAKLQLEGTRGWRVDVPIERASERLYFVFTR